MSSHILGLGPEVAVFHPEMAFAWKSGLSVKADGMSGNAPGPLTDSTLHKLPLPSSLCSEGLWGNLTGAFASAEALQKGNEDAGMHQANTF